MKLSAFWNFVTFHRFSTVRRNQCIILIVDYAYAANVTEVDQRLLKEQYPVTWPAPNFGFWTGCREIKRCEESKRTLKNPFASRLAEFNTTLKLLRITDQWYIVPVKFWFGPSLEFLALLLLPLAGGPKDGKRFNADWRLISSATTSCESTWDTVPYFGIKSLSMILCLWSLLHPLSKLLAIQERTQNLEQQLWMGGRREVSVISHRPVTRGDLKQERSFFRGSVSTFFAAGCLSPSYPYSRGARLLNGVKRGALLAPKEVVIKTSISFS